MKRFIFLISILFIKKYIVYLYEMKKLYVLIVAFLLFTGIAYPQDMLTWEDCVKEAKSNHPDLIAEKEKLNQAKADKAIAVSDFLPQVTTSLSGKTAKAATGATTDTYAYSVTGEQLLFNGFKTFYDIRATSQDIKSAQYNYEVTSSNVRLRLRTAFTELLKAQELMAITEDIAARREKNLELVQLRYEAGREHKGSLLTAQANLAQAEFELSQAKRNISLAQRKLTKELGRRLLLPLKVKGELKITNVDKERPDFERLAEDTPFLQALIAEKDSARFSLKSSRADFFPEVYASASSGKTGSKWSPDDDVWSAGATVTLPIFEGGSRIAQVSKAKAVFKQAEADEMSGRDNVLLTLEEIWKELQDAIDKVEVQQKFLDAAQERAKITQAQYSTGLIAFDNWTIIEDDLVSAKKSFLNSKSDALIAEAYWIQAEGGTLDYE